MDTYLQIQLKQVKESLVSARLNSPERSYVLEDLIKAQEAMLNIVDSMINKDVAEWNYSNEHDDWGDRDDGDLWGDSESDWMWK